MGGLLRFLAWFVLLVAGFVLIALPLLLGPFLSQMVREMGVRATTLDVSVALFDPGLLFGRSRQVTLVATDVDASPARIGQFRLSLGNASYFDRSFETISGEVNFVSVSIGNDIVSAESIRVDGPAEAAGVTARLSETEVEKLIRVSAGRAGVSIDDVRLTEAGVFVTVRGFETVARLDVRGGALLLEAAGQQVVLIDPARNDPWSLQEAWISDQGLNLRGTVNVRRIVRDLAADN
ncbi:MAG: hypothetical protein ABI797_06425 [Chloroflexota bacterium]